ncbi:NAD(P)-binding protein [Mycena vulgaris]|nr:NAD(P)-binding protein [Mycena vulgaris]
MSSITLILVIGATGAQGRAVIDALLAPAADGAASPYSVRALTRDPESAQARALAARGVECAVTKALDGVYGAWVNTDGFTVGEMEEIYAGMRIFELAKRTPNLRYVFKKAGYDPEYKTDHMDAKGRVGEWLAAQPSDPSEDGLAWSQVTTGPYMDTINGGLFRPLNVREDGTVVWAAPLEDARVPLIALKDLGWWARWTFDHRAEASARELNVTSECIAWDQLVETFTRVTGRRAVYRRLSLDECVDDPISNEKRRGDGSTTIRENMGAFWRVMRDGLIDKDMAWVRSVHPGTYTLERWMRESGYNGEAPKVPVLKNTQDRKNPWGVRKEVASLL